jgi:hypothetical protein
LPIGPTAGHGSFCTHSCAVVMILAFKSCKKGT